MGQKAANRRHKSYCEAQKSQDIEGFSFYYFGPLRHPTLHPILFARAGSTEDAEAMASVIRPGESSHAGETRAECERILRSTFGFSVVVTRQVGRGAPKIVGVENGTLITAEFAEALFTAERPYIHHHIRDAEHPFPTEGEVAKANAGEGSHFLLTHFALDSELDPAEAIRVRGLMVSTFAEFFAGNRIRSILVETGGEGKRTALGAGFQVRREYGHDLCLMEMDLARAIAVQNFHFARLLDYREPVFGFPPLAREALRLAIQGLTDVQTTERFGISGSSLASRWNRIFDIVEEVMPELFDASKGKRSRDRLPLLAYVRAHPEELWPYDPA